MMVEDEYDYTFTLLRVKIKHKEPLQMAISNRRYQVYLIAPERDGVYVFNQRFVIREGRQRKQHIDLLVNLYHEHKKNYIAGVIVLNRYQLQPSEDVIRVRLNNCLDEHAYCELQVNHIDRVETIKTRKRGDSMVIPADQSFGEPLFGYKSTLGVSPSNECTRDGGWLSDHRSDYSITERFPQSEVPQAELKKQLNKYKFQLQAQKVKVKELSRRVAVLQLERDEEKESKLMLESSIQDWEIEKHYLQSALKRSQLENRRVNQLYLKEIQGLRKLVVQLKEGRKEEDIYYVSVNGKKTQRLSSPVQRLTKERDYDTFFKKKAVTFQETHPSQQVLKKNTNIQEQKYQNLTVNPQSK